MDTTTLINEVRDSGYCVIEGVVPEDRCVDIRRRLLAVVDCHRRSSSPGRIGFVPSVINHDQSFANDLANPRLMQIATALLGHDLRISFTSVIVNEPGNERGGWHADWPFNQNNAGHIEAPYPDAVFHLTTLWMISPFSEDNGGTLVVPGSHRRRSNPTHSDHDVDVGESLATEVNVAGPIGSVLLFDSRLWHSTAPNRTDDPRVALAVRYAPWWLNLEVLRPESNERRWLCEQTGKNENEVPPIDRDVFAQLPDNVQPLYRHWVKTQR